MSSFKRYFIFYTLFLKRVSISSPVISGLSFISSIYFVSFSAHFHYLYRTMILFFFIIISVIKSKIRIKSTSLKELITASKNVILLVFAPFKALLLLFKLVSISKLIWKVSLICYSTFFISSEKSSSISKSKC